MLGDQRTGVAAKPAADPPASPGRGIAAPVVSWLRRQSEALTAFGLFLPFGLWFARDLWFQPGPRLLTRNPYDHELFLWWIGWGAHVVRHLDDPFVTHAINAPDGVNAMVNTSILVPSIVLAPLTWLCGPGTTFAFLTTVASPLTGLTVYLTLRRFDFGRAGALGGGLAATLAPGLHSQGLAHMHMYFAVLVPLIVGDALALALGRGRPVRVGVRLAVLTAVQLMTGEEWLVIAAVAVLAAVTALAARHRELRRAQLRRALPGLAAGAAVLAALVAWPVAVQLRGPQHISGALFDINYYVADLKAFVTPSELLYVSTSTSRELALTLRGGITEQTSYVGWAFLLWLLVAAVLLRRRPAVWISLAAAAAVFVCALGPRLTIGGRGTSLVLPWVDLGQLPLVDQALPVRMAVAIPLLLSPVVAAALDWSWAHRRTLVGAVGGALTLVVLALWMPRPLATTPAPPAPPAFSHAIAPAGHALLTVPLAGYGASSPLRWEAEHGIPDHLAGAYAILPGATGRPQMGSSPYQLTELAKAAADGQVVPVDAALRAAVLAELHARDVCSVAVLPDPHQTESVALVTAVLGAPTTGGGMPIWQLCP